MCHEFSALLWARGCRVCGERIVGGCTQYASLCLPITSESLAGADNIQASCHLLLLWSSVREMENPITVIAECRWGPQVHPWFRNKKADGLRGWTTRLPPPLVPTQGSVPENLPGLQSWPHLALSPNLLKWSPHQPLFRAPYTLLPLQEA